MISLGKRGNVLDFFYILAVLAMTGICIFAAFIIINTTAEADVFKEDPEANAAVQTTKTTILNFDNLMLFVIVGLSLFVIISSALVFNHPAMFIISFILLCIAVVVAATVSNAFWAFANEEVMKVTAANFPKIIFLMDKLPFYVAFLGIAAAIAMYVGYQQQ